METHTALDAGRTKLVAHRVAARIFGQLQVIHARHHRRQIIVGIFVEVERFADDGQRWIIGFEAAAGQAR